MSSAQQTESTKLRNENCTIRIKRTHINNILIFSIFKIKWPKSEEKLNFGGRWVWLSEPSPTQNFVVTPWPWPHLCRPAAAAGVFSQHVRPVCMQLRHCFRPACEASLYAVPWCQCVNSATSVSGPPTRRDRPFPSAGGVLTWSMVAFGRGPGSRSGHGREWRLDEVSLRVRSARRK